MLFQDYGLDIFSKHEKSHVAKIENGEEGK
jgi:hypothetical protein